MASDRKKSMAPPPRRWRYGRFWRLGGCLGLWFLIAGVETLAKLADGVSQLTTQLAHASDTKHQHHDDQDDN